MLFDIPTEAQISEETSTESLEGLQLRVLEDADLIHVGGGNCVADY
jgi:hypothetical protein